MGLFFQSEQSLLDLKQEKNSPEDVKTYLQKQGVTQDELKDTGLLTYLDESKDAGEKVTKTGLLAFLGESKPNQTVVHLEGGSRGESWSDSVTDNNNDWDIAGGTSNSEPWRDEWVEQRADNIFDELSGGSPDYQVDWFFMTRELHNANPTKYPLTPAIEYDTASEKLLNLNVDERNPLLNTTSKVIEERTRLNAKKESARKLMSIHDTWEYTLHKDLATASGIRGMNDSGLTQDIQEASKRLATNEFNEDPIYHKQVEIDGADIDIYRDQEGQFFARDENNEELLQEFEGVYSANEAIVQINDRLGVEDNYGAKTMHTRFTQDGADVETYDEYYIQSDMVDNDGGYSNTAHHGVLDNVFLHVRSDVRTDVDNNDVLFIEEIQSDLHQDARKKDKNKKAIGYKATTDEKELREIKLKSNDLYREFLDVKNIMERDGYTVNDTSSHVFLYKGDEKIGKMALDLDSPTAQYNIDPTSIPEAEFRKIDDWFKEYRVMDNRNRTNNDKKHAIMDKMPNAPLKNDKWIKTALKQQIEVAKKKGINRVAWTTPQQQVDMWSAKYKKLYTELYGNKLPSIAEKLANEYGGKTGKTKIEFGSANKGFDADGNIANFSLKEVNYIDITPEMKTKTKDGMPLYSVAPVAGGLLGAQEEEPRTGLLN